MKPLFDAFIDVVAAPEGDETKPFSMLVSLIEHVDILGHTMTGKVYTGKICKGETIHVISRDGKVSTRWSDDAPPYLLLLLLMLVNAAAAWTRRCDDMMIVNII